MHIIECIMYDENLNKICFQLRRISGTGKAQARVDKYENKRYVVFSIRDDSDKSYCS